MRYKDYYEVMGVRANASQDEIKRAYRKLARKFHPDVSKEKDAEEKFKELQEAHEVLKDPEKRAAYDQLGAGLAPGPGIPAAARTGARASSSRAGAGGRGGAGMGEFSDFFSELFGDAQPVRPDAAGAGRAGRQPRIRGAPARTTSPASRSTSRTPIRGGSRDIELRSPELTADGHVVVKPRTLRVTIPAGVTEGQQIRLAGQGSPGIGGGPPGNLLLEIGLPAPSAIPCRGPRHHDDACRSRPGKRRSAKRCRCRRSAAPVDMKLPAGARAGQKLRLRGRGLPGPTPGDQYVVLEDRAAARQPARAGALRADEARAARSTRARIEAGGQPIARRASGRSTT